MNIYKEINKEQKQLLEEAGEIIEDRDYNKDEVRKIQNVITEYIFSKSKKQIGQVVNKYSDILRIIGD